MSYKETGDTLWHMIKTSPDVRWRLGFFCNLFASIAWTWDALLGGGLAAFMLAGLFLCVCGFCNWMTTQ